MILKKAQAIAENILAELAPHCDRCEIAGSIRRKKPEVGDIEIVAIPKCFPADLFGGKTLRDPSFVALVQRWPALKGSAHGKYTQRWIKKEGINLDLFMAVPDNWGAILLIRTGNSAFSKYFVGSLLPSKGYKQKDGFAMKNDAIISVPEESDMFRLAGVPWVEPTERNL